MGRKIKVFLIVLVVLLIAIGGFFYWWENWQPWKTEGNPPTLFNKDDYKIVEKNSEKFIEVKKVGLTAKVPKGWNIEIQGNDIPEPGYWVDLSSPDIEKTSGVMIKGCGITLWVEINEQKSKEIKNSINFTKDNPKDNRICGEILGTTNCEDYSFEIIEFNNYQSLKQVSPIHKLFGQAENITIPLNKNRIISFGTNFLSNYKEKCLSVWEEFIKNISIK